MQEGRIDAKAADTYVYRSEDPLGLYDTSGTQSTRNTFDTFSQQDDAPANTNGKHQFEEETSQHLVSPYTHSLDASRRRGSAGRMRVASPRGYAMPVSMPAPRASNSRF
jgi:hypothetical protein